MTSELVRQRLEETMNVMEKTKQLSEEIVKAADEIEKCYRNKGKVVLFGNGGSAAQAQHISAEFVNKFLFDRPALAALSLTTDTSNITSIGNDSGYSHVFSRQIEALCNKGDVVIGFTTSDATNEKEAKASNSPSHSANIYNGFKAAKDKGCLTIGMLSERSIKTKEVCDIPIMIPSKETPRIQEAHIAVLHTVCEIVEKRLFGDLK